MELARFDVWLDLANLGRSTYDSCLRNALRLGHILHLHSELDQIVEVILQVGKEPHCLDEMQDLLPGQDAIVMLLLLLRSQSCHPYHQRRMQIHDFIIPISDGYLVASTHSFVGIGPVIVHLPSARTNFEEDVRDGGQEFPLCNHFEVSKGPICKHHVHLIREERCRNTS